MMQACAPLLMLWMSSTSVPCVAAGEVPDGAGQEMLAGVADEDETLRSPSVRGDLARVYGATLLYSLVYPDVRGPLLGEGSLARVGGHLRRPIRSAVEGWREDDDPFFTNFVAHPASWGAIGYYLRSRGHSGTKALLMSQGHSLFWEYVLEGTYQRPSGKDLVMNFASAWLGIALAGWVEGGNGSPRVEVRPGGHSAGSFSFPGQGFSTSAPRGVTLEVRLSL